MQAPADQQKPSKESKGTMMNNTACHHPYFCEKNENCRGTRIKKIPDTEKNKKGKPYISHCCMKPSHLVNLNGWFNKFCTVMNQLELMHLDMKI